MTGVDLSPLEEIERAVLDRAQSMAIDMGQPEGAVHMRELVEDEVARWGADHARGARPMGLADPGGVVERAHRNLCGYGPLAPLLADDDVWEVMVNAPDQIFVKRHRGLSGYHDEVFHDDAHVLRILTKILDDASGAHRSLDPAEGLQDAQLDDGARLHIVHQDIARGGHVMVNIRKFTGVVFRSLDQLVERGTLTRAVAALLRASVRAGASIVIAGAPGAGKTTLLSCCTAELDPRLRVVTAEEVFEVEVPLPNVASLQTRAARPERPAVDLRRLVAGFLRMAPDVAIVGEVRDREALPLLLTLSSGVEGFTTIHAGSARQALSRLRFICQLSDGDLPLVALNGLITEAIDVVVHCTREADGPRVDEVVAVEDLAAAVDGAAFTLTELHRRDAATGALVWTGQIPHRLAEMLQRVGVDVRAVLDEGGAPVRSTLALALGVAAAYGTHLVVTGWALGWEGLGPGPRRSGSGVVRLGRHRVRAWRAQAGLDDVRPLDLLAAAAVLGVLGAALGYVVFGAAVPALAVAVATAATPIIGAGGRRRARRAAAQEAWPRMIEEIRIQTASVGRSVPVALLEVGRRGPPELRADFDAAAREWLTSTDFARTVAVLKDRLADPTADATCETLLVAHEVGGSDLDARLRRLAEDRIADVQARRDARAEQAGARYARAFVLIVPLGMAVAGASLGEGRAAYRSGMGQVAVLAALAMVAACWTWSGAIMRLPQPERVFDR